MSQSLLHQVCGWNVCFLPGNRVRRVSIPSSSGLRLEWNCIYGRAGSAVSIPSSSGLRLECMYFARIRTTLLRVSIPSSSGLRLEYKPYKDLDDLARSQSLLHQVCGWNRTCVVGVTGCASLNPFFIRSAVGIVDAGYTTPAWHVSIPSSSGLRLECDHVGYYIVSLGSQSLLHQVCGWNRPWGSTTRRRGRSQSLLHQVCGWNTCTTFRKSRG